MNQEMTRIFLWELPRWYVFAMYFFFAISLVGAFIAARQKWLFLTNKGKIRFALPNQNFRELGLALTRAGKAHNTNAFWFHAPIFFGFLVFLLATILAMVHIDTPFSVFKGLIYKTVSFASDLFAVLALVGIVVAFIRRYILKPEHLKSSRPKQELFMYVTLASLIIVGLLLEALRIHGTGVIAAEMWVSPIGALLAHAISFMEQTTTAMLHRLLWFLHMLSTMLFIGIFFISKFDHIFLLPLAALLSRQDYAALAPMNFENEDAETFGLFAVKEMELRERLASMSCIECGRCTLVCPAKRSGKELDPKQIIAKIKDKAQADFKSPEELDFWTDELFSADELDACTSCGACTEACPAYIEHTKIIMELKRYKGLTLGEFPAAAATTMANIENNQNPWGISLSDRFKWADGLNVPVITPEQEVDYLFFVGCSGSYDPNYQKIIKDCIKIFETAELSYAVLGDQEPCCGDSVRRFGNEYQFHEMAINNIELLRQFKFKHIVSCCPHGLHTIGKEYAKFENGTFECLHMVELIEQLIHNGILQISNRIALDTTFHDPCYLGRHGQNYSSSRFLLNLASQTPIKEMKHSASTAFCCGMGGGNMWYEINQGHPIGDDRIKDVLQTGASEIATSCPFCFINFNLAKNNVEAGEKLVIKDVISTVAPLLEKAPPQEEE